MRDIERRFQVGRRGFLRGAASVVPATALGVGALGISAEAAWAKEATALQPRTLATLVRMSRDIYPHDQIPDLHYVRACKPFDKAAGDKAAGGGAEARDLFEQGVVRLDADAHDRHRLAYLDVPEEADRVALLHGIEATPFFNKVRSGLVVSLYNQPEIWHRFGYEGSSAEYGGYIARGFNDIDWLPAV